MTEKVDLSFLDKYDWVAGLDEAGWGPIAGPLQVAVVVLQPHAREDVPEYIRDSKTLRGDKLQKAYEWVIKNASYMSSSGTPADDFDTFGAGSVRDVSFLRAIEWVAASFEKDGRGVVVIDGSYKPDISIPNVDIITLVKGDRHVKEISCASIVAKVDRDACMISLAKEYPQFRWDKNKGYGTKQHLDVLKKLGATKHHRKNIKIVKAVEKFRETD